ncbi:MAG: DUF6455 family protein [Paenirhodobacter sp.]|uniref:DUF6455 family protein n=1 Tax=Paenirhodobacter sp. TaxID=1965326 RepID=UPI003D13819B
MFGLKTLNRHAALMNRMAQVLGVDLTEAMAKRHLSGDEWREAVIRCTSCCDPESCQHWLADHDAPEAHDGEATAEVAPEYCNNRLMMARLRAILTEEPEAPLA